MEHTIVDYLLTNNEGGEKDLVTSPPGYRDTRTVTNLIIGNPSPEELRSSINKKFNEKLCNEVTITFTDKWIIPYKIEYIQMKLHEFLHRWQNVADYIMIQDYSHVGRIHYHGILEMKQIDKFERLIINLRKTFGRVECKQITYWESYLKYMTGVYEPSHDKFMTAIEWNKNRYITNKVL